MISFYMMQQLLDTFKLIDLLYIELSNSNFISQKCTLNFKISACDVLTADYTIIVSRTLMVNHVMYDHSASG